ncbi:hypothetical protein HK098_007101 [Nowakowskiella sp. JEL0407]|nr:hypothetical protein HK098_007101 [Nowakowskiella sp. JEL0407]
MSQFTYIENLGIKVANGSPSFGILLESPDEVKSFVYSDNGLYCAWIYSTCIKIFETKSNTEVSTLQTKSALAATFSPMGSYICVHERYQKPANNEPQIKNQKIYQTTTAKLLFEFSAKSLSQPQFTATESHFTRLVDSEIHIYDISKLNPDSPTATTTKFSKSVVSQYSLSQGQRPLLAVFTKQSAKAPGALKLFDFTSHSLLASKSFYKADSISFFWNFVGTSLLGLTKSDMDTTGKSYYGDTNLFLLSVSGVDQKVGLAPTEVSGGKEGAVHDVHWNPKKNEFIVCFGSMPSKTWIFDGFGRKVAEVVEGPRNSIRWSKDGRNILVGGFGNLSGELDIFEISVNGAGSSGGIKKVATVNAENSSFCEWDPYTDFFMTAIMYKRLKVDNGIKIWHKSGILVECIQVKELFEVGWKPDLDERSKITEVPPKWAGNSANGAASEVKVEKKVGAYRPPGARGKPATFSLRSADLDTPFESVKSTATTIPGMAEEEQLSKTALKNKKKREAKKAGDSDSPAANSPAPPPPAVITSNATEKEKKIKALNKKLKQIAEIKVRRDAGEKLELTQIQKMESESTVLQELEKLQLE